MNGLGVYRWSNGRRAALVACARHAAWADVARGMTVCSIFKGQWKENNMHGCGKKWYPGGALEEVRRFAWRGAHRC